MLTFRLLDLAIAYALDNPAIHDNDVDNVQRLRRVHQAVIEAADHGSTELTIVTLDEDCF